MVTAGASKGAVITLAGLAGLVVGLWVQEKVRFKQEVRVERRIQKEVERRRAQTRVERKLGQSTTCEA